MTPVGPRPKVGDVFTIPIDTNRVAVGQVVDKVHKAWWVAVYDRAFNAADLIDIEAALGYRVRLLALTFDARIRHGYWPRIGRHQVDTAALKWPTFQTMTPDGDVVTDHHGDGVRSAGLIDRVRLPRMTFVSPMTLEEGVQALFGARRWETHFNDLLASDARRP